MTEAISTSISETLRPWLALHRAVAGAHGLMRELLARYGQPAAVFEAPRRELEPLLSGRPDLLAALTAGIEALALDAEQAWLAQPDAHVVTLADPDYPLLLREIPDPPPLLYVRGRRAALAAPQLAVVGSRNPTPGGCDNARAFAHTLAGAGLTVTSGLATGIDACAHQAALDAGGATVAVTGTGLDRVYPAAHRELAHAIAAGGALVSEFVLGTPPRRENFPRRNRIISGLSLGVLVVEAAVQSGSLITARLAGEQGREVFAIPGSIHSPLARGCHALIRQGAKLVETAEDILEELGPLASLALAPVNEAAPARSESIEAEFPLLAQLGYDPVDVDTLAGRSGLTPGMVSSMLLAMELEGLIQACPGGKYQRIV